MSLVFSKPEPTASSLEKTLIRTFAQYPTSSATDGEAHAVSNLAHPHFQSPKASPIQEKCQLLNLVAIACEWSNGPSALEHGDGASGAARPSARSRPRHQWRGPTIRRLRSAEWNGCKDEKTCRGWKWVCSMSMSRGMYRSTSMYVNYINVMFANM